MRGRGGGFGMVALVIVMAVVLLLVARAWMTFGTKAVEVTRPAQGAPGADPAGRDAGSTPAGQPSGAPPGGALRPGQLPDLQEMQQKTDAHTATVEDALEKTQ